ncbi:MAG: PhzF family phenazine biosynthesis isomerase, partial [Olsenella sp.]|nr:PhzF family phenazine biosynthesis isomerase [Olsenella sp.]
MKQYIVDAFTDQLFCGNQAAVCVVDEWPTDRLMQDIAKENRFSETAFVVREQQGWHLRWFTPGGEIDFCGHATLGTAFVLFRFYCPDAASIAFDTQVGRCSVERQGDLYVMDFPSYACTAVPVTDAMEAAIGVRPKEAYLDRDLMLVL